MPRLTLRRAGRLTLLAALIGCTALASIAIETPRAHAAQGLELGFFDGDYTSSDAAGRTTARERSVQAGAGSALIYITWSGVAPREPGPGFRPTHPNDPRYNWDQIDAAVRDASARVLRIVLAITSAPPWAEGP